MLSVVTLVSPATIAALDDVLLRRVAQSLPKVQEAIWLDERLAADLVLAAPVTEALKAQVRDTLEDRPIDFFVQPVAWRRKKLLIADMDSTMIEQECLDELADFAGLKAHIATITARAMRGDIPFEPALRERVALLKGLDAQVIGQIIAERISMTPGAQTLVRTMRACGAYTVLVTGGFTAFSRDIAPWIGFDAHVANVLGITEGRLNGEIKDPVLGRAAKCDALKRYREELNLSPDETLAVGDGANDLDMLAEAGLGVAFHAKPAVAAAAQARVEHGDLTALLYAQGYRRADFVA
jgi:phosphoserine phosphatase